MGHDHHPHGHSHAHDGSIAGLRTAFLLNFAFTLIEIGGGFWTNSIAILSDAVHDLGDSLSLGFAWWMAVVATRAENERFTYGYRRFSLLGGLLTALVMIVGSVVIASHAIARLSAPPEPHAGGMVVLAVLGIAVNGAAAWRLRKSGHGLTEQVVSLHLLEDVLGWAAVLLVSIILLFWNVPILDPILSLAITAWVLFNILRSTRRIGLVFLQATPENVSIRRIQEFIREDPRAISVHDAHVWSLDGERHILSAHVVLDPATTHDEAIALKRRLRELAEGMDITHCTIELE